VVQRLTHDSIPIVDPTLFFGFKYVVSSPASGDSSTPSHSRWISFFIRVKKISDQYSAKLHSGCIAILDLDVRKIEVTEPGAAKIDVSECHLRQIHVIEPRFLQIDVIEIGARKIGVGRLQRLLAVVDFHRGKNLARTLQARAKRR
jgi:hypothetical protein